MEMMLRAFPACQMKRVAVSIRRPENPAHRLCMGRAGNGGVSPIEVDYVGADSSASDPEPPKPFMSTVQTHSDNRTFQVRMGKMLKPVGTEARIPVALKPALSTQVLLAVITQLWQSPEQLEAFLRSRPEPTSMPFLLWLADQVIQRDRCPSPP